MRNVFFGGGGKRKPTEKSALFGGMGERGWFVDGPLTPEGVSVRVKDVTGLFAGLLEDLVGPEVAHGGQGFGYEYKLVYLAKPTLDDMPAWDAAFFATTFWHPSWSLNEAQQLYHIATQSARDWWVARRAPEWAILYGLPRHA